MDDLVHKTKDMETLVLGLFEHYKDQNGESIKKMLKESLGRTPGDETESFIVVGEFLEEFFSYFNKMNGFPLHDYEYIYGFLDSQVLIKSLAVIKRGNSSLKEANNVLGRFNLVAQKWAKRWSSADFKNLVINKCEEAFREKNGTH